MVPRARLTIGQSAGATVAHVTMTGSPIEDSFVTFIEKLDAAWRRNDSLLCVGLDPDLSKIPAHLRDRPDAILQFCKAIIDATAASACAFKPQIAYFAAAAAESQLEAVCEYLRAHYPHLPIVLDAKRGDIGATAQQYAREAFERYGADAVTVNPYMGFDSVAPYLEWQERGVIILCRTSNAGGADLQNLQIDGTPLYQHVARLVADKWNTNGQCALVVGATYPDELAQVRAIVGSMPLLVPGIGAQGGDVAATVAAGACAAGRGMMINSSRAILFAQPHTGEEFAQAAARMAETTRCEINRYRGQTLVQ